MKRSPAVRTYAGTPPASTFNSADGTPIVIDTTTNLAYYLNAGVVTGLGGNVNVKNFGAVGNGVTDDTAAINSAISTGKSVFFPDGTYYVKDALNCTTKGQVLYGFGRVGTTILVDSAFNLSALGVFVFSSGEEGPYLHDIGIKFTQPDTTVRGSLIAYPPAIYAQGQPRFTLSNLLITNAMTGIDMRGNAGGAFLDLIEISSYTTAVSIDGSLDSIRINRLHHYPFGMTANQQTIFIDANNIGLKCGRADDFKISESLFIGGGKQAWFFKSGTSVFGSIVNTDFDAYGTLQFDYGRLALTSCYLGAAGATNVLKQIGGTLEMTDCDIGADPATVTLFPITGGATDNIETNMSACRFHANGDVKVIDASTSGAYIYVSLIGCDFDMPTGTTPANSVVNMQTGTRLTAIGNRMTDKGAGAGTWLTIAQDNLHQIIGNSPVGWLQSIPRPYALTSEFANGGADAWYSGFTPAVASTGGAITTSSATMRYKQIGKTMLVNFNISITTNGTGSGSITLTVPSNAVAYAVGAARDYSVGGKTISVTLPTASSTMTLVNYDNTYPGANGSTISGNITYEIN